MLYFIGLGLCDGKDITLRGREALRKCKKIYLESYTSILQCTHAELEKALGCKIKRLSRDGVEKEADKLLDEADEEDIALLVVGDPFGATTHSDLYLRARERNIAVRVIHNASIMLAVGEVGLELYKYGRTVSIPYWEKGYQPVSFLDNIKKNHADGLHTLCLLDIKADEERLMTVGEAIDHLEKAESTTEEDFIQEHLPAIGIARLGCPDARIVAGTLKELRDTDFGKPPHCMIIPGKLHPIEEEMLGMWSAELSR